MKLDIRPMKPEERLYIYQQSSQIEGQTGSIGRLRGDFGKAARSFIPHGRIISRNSVPMILTMNLIRSSTPCVLKMWAAVCLEAAISCGFSARKTRTAPFRETTARNTDSVSTKGGTAS